MINQDGGTPRNSKTRFAVLRHVEREGTHYDLLIDKGESLATWKMTDPPEYARRSNLACRSIGDHRRIYLEYEGPISNDRGHVTQHDAGSCDVLEVGPDVWRIRFEGRHLAGDFLLERDDQGEDAWRLRAISD